MSKSILVIDTQENCERCPLFRRDIDSIPEEYCFDGVIKREIVDLNKKPDWCPLKEIPEKKEVRNFCFGQRDFEQQGYQQGWNSCIKEIFGENK